MLLYQDYRRLLGAPLVVALALMLLPWAACASTSSALWGVDTETLAADEQWQILGRWKRRMLPGAGLRSDIISRDFFLADNGRFDPEAELRATLEGMAMPLGANPDDSIFCRYPGRAEFLRQQGADLPDPVLLCPKLSEFLDGGTTDSVSVLFISGYLSNPGSAYGHLLLRFHSEGKDEPAEDVLDRAINYGAASSEDDPLIPYIAKGLFGGYHSTYTSLQFYHQAERYREIELRTIWQYRLKLSDEEARLLITHVYEILTSENRYYFLRQNCAWRIAETLELVVDRDLIPNTKLWVTPIDVFHQLTGDAEDGGPAVDDVKRLASRETLFLEGYAALSVEEKRAVDHSLEAPSEPLSQLIADAGLDDPRAVYDVLLDYYAFTHGTEAEEERQQALTAERFKHPPSNRPTELRRIPPHTGQRPSLIQATALYNDALGEGVEIRLRPAYFDLLSSTVGTVPYSEVSMGDTRVLIRDGGIDLRSLEVVRVTSLSPKTANAPQSGGVAWRFRMGAEDRDLACDRCLLGYAEYGVGKAYEVGRGTLVYGLMNARAEAGRHVDSIVHVRPTAGFLVQRRRVAASLAGGVLQGLDDTDETRLFGEAEVRLGSGQRWDVRLRAAYDEALESGVSVGLYW
ncbi:MAG: DUF4105 domain-containing protein [Pseudomonadota bacterium]